MAGPRSPTGPLDVIGAAKGVLMVRHQIDEHAAAEQMRDTADRLDRDLREVAEEIVDDQRP